MVRIVIGPARVHSGGYGPDHPGEIVEAGQVFSWLAKGPHK
jgi:hypothetical protein